MTRRILNGNNTQICTWYPAFFVFYNIQPFISFCDESWFNAWISRFSIFNWSLVMFVGKRMLSSPSIYALMPLHYKTFNPLQQHNHVTVDRVLHPLYPVNRHISSVMFVYILVLSTSRPKKHGQWKWRWWKDLIFRFPIAGTGMGEMHIQMLFQKTAVSLCNFQWLNDGELMITNKLSVDCWFQLNF